MEARLVIACIQIYHYRMFLFFLAHGQNFLLMRVM